MGISLFKVSGSSFDRNERRVAEKTFVVKGNPIPSNYKILSNEVINGYLILLINYPDANNYEGNKILVFDKGVTVINLLEQVNIDPHFSNNENYISPLARFEPTDRGMEMARVMCKNMVS